MIPGADPIPDDVSARRAALAVEPLARREAETRASGAEAMVAHLKLLIAKLRHEPFGASSERGRKLLDQLERQLEELEAGAAEDPATLDAGAAGDRTDRGRAHRKPVRGPLPAHLPRERVVVPGPTACPCCQGTLSKLGEDVTETLEAVPRRLKVIQTVREKTVCRACETITQPPAPFHPIARGRAGPELLAHDAFKSAPALTPTRPPTTVCLRGGRVGVRAGADSMRKHRALATILEAEFGQHLPLHRQSQTFAREGIERDTSTLADWVGACTATLAPPAALFPYSPDRRGEHPQRHLASYAGILQADADAGFGELHHPGRKPGPITEAGCWAHGRRKLFDLAQLARAPLAAEAVRRIDAIFDAERAINGLPAEQRLAVRPDQVAPLVAEPETWMRAARGKMSRHADVGRAMDDMLERWDTFCRFLGDGRIGLGNNAAERALRGVALGRRLGCSQARTVAASGLRPSTP